MCDRNRPTAAVGDHSFLLPIFFAELSTRMLITRNCMYVLDSLYLFGTRLCPRYCLEAALLVEIYVRML